MTIFDKIDIAESFKTGSANDDQFVDYPHMSVEQLQSLATFVAGVVNRQPLKGKNKPSWLDDNHQEIPNSSNYRDNDYWHYHCGPEYSGGSVRSMTFNLNMNLSGLTSAEVIHYQKIYETGTIRVLGFSPSHEPFPRADDEANVLFSSECEE